MSRRLLALLAAFVLPIAIAYGFYEFSREIAPPALRADNPQILTFIPWCLPLAFLVSWIAGKGPQGHAWSGLFGALVGGVVGFVYFWALLITTNGMFLAYPFSVVAAWTLGASLALMLAWTPKHPLAWALDAATVVAIFALVRWQIGSELQPKPVLAVLWRPGTTQQEGMNERDRLFMIRTVNGKDYPPGVFQFSAVSAGPEGLHFEDVPGIDTTGIAIVFSPRATETQRAEVLASALSSPLVARAAWAPPGAYEKEQARLAADAGIRTEGRVTGNP
jgi:hypothetical protein